MNDKVFSIDTISVHKEVSCLVKRNKMNYVVLRFDLPEDQHCPEVLALPSVLGVPAIRKKNKIWKYNHILSYQLSLHQLLEKSL